MADETYAKFWLRYLHEHGRPETRELHIAGTAVAALFLLAGATSLVRKPDDREISPGALFALAAVAGYGPAWIGHFFFERNRPATFEHPLWSFVSDLRMVWLWTTGRLQRELEIAGVETPITDAASQLAKSR
jgi:hypothetical protein